MDNILHKEEVEMLNTVPDKYIYREIDFDGPTIYLNDISFKLPLGFIDSKTISRPVYDKQPHSHDIIIYSKSTKKLEANNRYNRIRIFYEDLAQSGLYNDNPSLPFAKNIYNSYIQNNRYFDIDDDYLSSKLNQYSWWNIPSNFNLICKLYLKEVALEKISKVSTISNHPKTKGFIYYGLKKGFIVFHIFNNNHLYSFAMIDSENYENNFEILEKVTSSIKIIENPSDTYKMLRKQYTENLNPIIPDELLLYSMISLNGINKKDIEDFQELKQVYSNLEDKYDKYIVNKINKRIDTLIDDFRISN